MSNEVKLLPCPFCGSTQPCFNDSHLSRRHYDDIYVVCRKCGCRTPAYGWVSGDARQAAVERRYNDARADAVATWNTRASEDTERLVRLEKALAAIRECAHGIMPIYRDVAQLQQIIIDLDDARKQDADISATD